MANAELAKKRVALRVSRGGHDVPEDVIERRFHLGLKNFFGLYSPIVDKWTFAENAEDVSLKIAEQPLNEEKIILDRLQFSYYQELVKS
ncbi:MAG: hypothetical protein FWH27_08955 [Planctomycetaceae bacterium]|nr:hypothetical protein [Planctomycetaceae bacterium]